MPSATSYRPCLAQSRPWAFLIQERVGVAVPDDPAVGVFDHRRGKVRDEAAVRVVEVGTVMEGKVGHARGMPGNRHRHGQ
jgi:hypothetical protein